jgi:hypothetical protein
VKPSITTAAEAWHEAVARRKEQNYLNREETMEFAYSPSTFAVGCRHDDAKRFRVFNVRYPMYGNDDGINDWVSVGRALPSGANPKRRPRKP